MTRPAITVHPEMTISQLVRLMLDRGVSGFPVTDHLGRVVGIVSESDLSILDEATPLSSDGPSGSDVLRPPIAGDVMTRDVITADEGTPVGTLASLMVLSDINRIPITTGRRVLGIVARDDLLRAFADTQAGPGGALPESR